MFHARCEFTMVFRVFIAGWLLVLGTAWAAGTVANGGNTIENITAQSLPGGKVIIKFAMKQPMLTPPGTFSVNTPPRIALDFAETANGTGKSTMELREGELRTLNVVQAGNRTRVVMSLNRSVPYETKVDGKKLLLTLQGGEKAATGSETATKFAEAAPAANGHSVREVDFRRGQAWRRPRRDRSFRRHNRDRYSSSRSQPRQLNFKMPHSQKI